MGKKEAVDKVIFFCDGKKCCKYNKDVKKCFSELVNEAGLKGEVSIEKMKCSGMCKKAPVFCIQPKDIWKGEVSEKKAKKLFLKHIA
ncbi:(2Fe-2S) ferredoxin domain-containing protein [Flavobacterium sp. '19STA2R22 D10 B1']|uniref:(2Fe-2S) ferredoxin domain-containing protein n=1 Tax=Flavobacterium aerium TaxID=3037261 RepID=UPI00278C339C|nr:(2Fe-2S) ferredoxin domain-containing protein [Flavobacterium sp. '19STA2R22 D10 B1']